MAVFSSDKINNPPVNIEILHANPRMPLLGIHFADAPAATRGSLSRKEGRARLASETNGMFGLF